MTPELQSIQDRINELFGRCGTTNVDIYMVLLRMVLVVSDIQGRLDLFEKALPELDKPERSGTINPVKAKD